MSVQVEKLEHNMVKLTIEIGPERLEEAMKHSYNRQKNQINMPGFRKGKVPYAMVERMYGPEVFYNDATDELIEAEYPVAVEECGEELTSIPSIEVVQIEKGKPFIFTAEVAVKPEVTLGKYVGVTVTKIDTTVSDADVDEAIEKERENNGRLVAVDRAIKEGDTVDIDFDGYLNGEQFEGGKAEGYALNIGSHTFVDTFEEQLVGKKAGEELDVNVTFPSDYQSKELAGQAVTFKVKVNEVKEKQLPDLDDEFAQDVSEFDTLDEYKASVREKLEKEKEEQARITKEDEAIKKICDKSEMDIPDAMVDTQVRSMMRDMEQNLANTGITMDLYYQYTGTTEAELKEQCKGQALEQIRYSLVLEKIAETEDFEVTEEEIDEELKKMAESYQMDPKTLLDIAGDNERNSIKRDKRTQKAVEFVMENAKERAKAKSKKDAEATDESDEKAEKKATAKKTTAKKSTSTKSTTAKKSTTTKKTTTAKKTTKKDEEKDAE